MSDDQSAKELGVEDEEFAPVVLPLPNFKFRHSPEHYFVPHDHDLVGRDDLLHELVAVLNDTRDTRGSYLIAGFRGAGKTSVVNKALELYNRKTRHLDIIQTRA